MPLNMVGMLCWLICLIVAGAMLPGGPTDYLHLGLGEMASPSPRLASGQASAR